MNKEIIEEMAQLYALGMLPAEEVSDFEIRIREDRSTQTLVLEYQRLLELDASSKVRTPSFQVYANIMEELDETHVERKPELKKRGAAKSPISTFLIWGGWAAAAAAVAVIGLGLFDGEAVEKGGSDIVLNNLSNPRLVAVKTPSQEFAVEDRMLELAGLAEAYWFSREGIPSGQQLEDSDTQVAEISGGFTIFDRRYNIGFIAVENLPREAPNKSYHVWAKFNETAKPVRAGTLPIGDESRGLFFFDLRDVPKGTAMDSLSFFVTEEDSEAPPKPSQMVVLRDV